MQDQAAKRAQKAQLKTTRLGGMAGRKVLEQARSRDALGFNLQEAQIKSANKTALRGFQGARNAQQLGAAGARSQVLQRGKQGQAALEQSLVSRGLIGTTPGAQQFAMIGDQTTAQLASIDQQLADALSELGLAESQTAAGGELALAQLLGQQNMSEQERMMALFELNQVAPPMNELPANFVNTPAGVPLTGFGFGDKRKRGT